MFAIYPGFEDLSLRVEVEWRGSKRTVVARLEQWPNSDKAVLVCQIEGEDNEFLLRSWSGFYCRDKPQRVLHRYVSSETGQPRVRWRWSGRAERQVRAIIERSFQGYRVGLQGHRVGLQLCRSRRVSQENQTARSSCRSATPSRILPFITS